MKMGAEKVQAMLKGEHNKRRGSFYVVARSLSHIEGGGAREMFRTRDFPISRNSMTSP